MATPPPQNTDVGGDGSAPPLTPQLREAFEAIDKLCDELDIPNRTVREIAKELYQALEDTDVVRGLSLEDAVAGCTHLATRSGGDPTGVLRILEAKGNCPARLSLFLQGIPLHLV